MRANLNPVSGEPLPPNPSQGLTLALTSTEDGMRANPNPG